MKRITMHEKSQRMQSVHCMAHAGGTNPRAALTMWVLVLLMALACVSPCHAQAVASQANVPNSEVGHSTQSWLELQRSNAAAAPVQPMLGAEAGLAYKRYMASFNSKIPDVYTSIMNQNGGGAQSGSVPQN